VLASTPANVAGAVALYLYFTYVDPIGGPIVDPVIDTIVFVVVMVPLVVAGWHVNRRWVRPIADWYRQIEAGADPADVPIAIRRRLLNAALIATAVSLATWLAGAVVYVLYQWLLLGQSWPEILRISAGIVFAGALPASAIGFLLAEFHWRRRIPEFFPDGKLDRRGVLRVPLRLRLATTFLLVAIVPLTVLLTLAWGMHLRFADALPAALATLWVGFMWANVYVVVVTVVASTVMALLVARFINRPIHALREAMRAVERGRLDLRVPVRSPDELGELNQHFNVMVEELRQAAEARQLFGRYVSPQVARRALERGVELGGEVVEATALFADLRGFTARSEALPAAAVVDLLAEYYAVVERVCNAEHGTITQFLGDGVVVVFGGPLDPVVDHADRAVGAAREMQRQLGQRMGPDGQPLVAGIGICTGGMIAGNVGAGERVIYTIVGDAVNQAARLQVKTRDLDHSILLTESTRDALRSVDSSSLHSCGRVALKGVASAAAVYAADL